MERYIDKKFKLLFACIIVLYFIFSTNYVLAEEVSWDTDKQFTLTRKEEGSEVEELIGNYDKFSTTMFYVEINDPNSLYTIYVNKDATITSDDLNEDRSNNKIRLTSASGGPYKLTRKSNRSLIDLSDNAVLTIDNLTVDGDGEGSLTYLNKNNSANYGGKLILGEGAIIQNFTNDLYSTVFVDEGEVIVKQGATIRNNHITAKGKSLFYIGPEGKMTVEGGTFENNSTNFYGGFIYSYSGDVDIEGGTFRNNTSPNSGVMAFYGQDSKINISGATFEDNSTTGSGGAILFGVDSKDIKIENTTFTNNKSKYLGGAIYAKRGQIDLNNVIFKNNSAEIDGGAIYLTGNISDVDINRGTFENNKSGRWGGAILAFTDNANVKINSSSFKNNNAESFGGAIITNKGRMELDNIKFENNEAKIGGAIFASENKSDVPKIDIKGYTEFNGNIANGGYGGAIFTITGSEINPAEENSYQNITVADTVKFSKNKALLENEDNSYTPPTNYKKFTNLQFASNSFTGENTLKAKSLLNNCDISYENPDLTVKYDANGGKFSDEREQLTENVAKDTGNLTEIVIISEKPIRNGYKFTGWIGEDGKIYKAGDKLKVKENAVFVAQWENEIQTLDIKVTKIWKDENENILTKNLPKEVKIKLNGEKELILNEKNNWSGKFEKLPIKEIDGSIKKYQLEEEKVNGFKTEITGNQDTGFIVTNTKIKEPKTRNEHKGSLLILSEERPKTQDHYQYMMGYEDKTFRPEKNITREEVAAMFARLYKERTTSVITKNDFTDVEDNRWSSEAISQMKELGILKGYPDGSFKPEKSITRAEFAAIATRLENQKTGNKTFIDVEEKHWAYREIQKAATAGWIEGYPDKTFKPEREITRAEVVKIANKMQNRIVDKRFVDRNESNITYLSDIKGHWAYYEIVEATNGHEYVRDTNGVDEIWQKLNRKSFV